MKHIYFLLFTLFVATNSYADTIPCHPNFFQVIYNEIKAMDPNDGSYDLIGGSGANWNAAGYNVNDGYVYGVRKSNGNAQMIQVDGNGTIVTLGNITSSVNGNTISTSMYSGDMNLNDELIVFNNSSKNSYWNIDITTQIATEISLTATGNFPTSTINDIAFRNADGKLFGVSNSEQLWMIDIVNNTISMVADLSPALGAISGGNGAAWTDVSGNIYFSNNKTGKIYKIELDANINVTNLVFIMDGAPASNNDGMSCPLADAPIESNCANGLDDDGDGLIDCEDPHCQYYFTCVPGEVCDDGIDNDYDGLTDSADPDCTTTSSNTGGLESNGDLASKVADRNFRNLIGKDNFPMFDPVLTLAGEDEVDLYAFLPAQIIPNTEIKETSLLDLVPITNAEQVVAFDVLNSNSNEIGAIIISETLNEVYEHSKVTCDRLNGASIESTYIQWFQSIPFIVTQLKHPTGQREFALSFGLSTIDHTSYNVESHWNLLDYPKELDYVNFQIWASNPNALVSMARSIVTHVKANFAIDNIIPSAAPGTYIQSCYYEHGMLKLNVHNESGATSLKLAGTVATIEKGARTPFTKYVSLSGAPYQSLNVDVDYFYDMNLLVKEDDVQIDAFYVSGGTWGTSYNANFTQSNTIVKSSKLFDESLNYQLHRDINVTADNKDKMTVYRSLGPSFRSTDLTEFNYLKFDVNTNADSIEVRIHRKGVDGWNKQFSKMVKVDSSFIMIDLMDESTTFTDVQSVLLVVDPKDVEGETLALDVANMRFAVEDTDPLPPVIMPEKAKYPFNSPNPIASTTTINFIAESATSMSMTVYSNMGLKVLTIEKECVKGINEETIDLSELPSGVYDIHIEIDGDVDNIKILKL